jgi:hypothetical protein
VAIKHAVDVDKVVRATLVETGGFFTIEVEVLCPGSIKKVLRIPHDEASFLESLVHTELGTLTDEERKHSFFASIRRDR